MKPSRALAASAACVALALTAAACGDDDDAAGDTTLVTVAPAGDTTPATDAPAGDTTPATDAPAGDTTPATDAPTGTPADGSAAPIGTGPDLPTIPVVSVSPEVAADCQAVFDAFEELFADGEPPADPAVGDEISDEYKDAVQQLVDAAEGVEATSAEVQEGIDVLVDFGNDVIDADTWTEELDTASNESFTPLTTACATYLATAAPATTGG